MLGLAVLALTVQATASGLGSQDRPSAAVQTEPDVAHLTVAGSGTESGTEGGAESVADRATPKVPALEVGATPVGARRPAALDGRRASRTGTLPGPAAYAYTFATSTLEEAEPRCGLSWSLLAAIGRIESDHGRAGASRLDDRGVVAPAFRSARLDGSDETTKVRDTDAGDLDRDRRFDRAVGPMQLLPTTWDVVGVDADGNGRRDPDDIDDAALSAAVLLCGAPGRLTDREGLKKALRRYNATPGYAAAVIGLEQQYRRTGVPVATLGGSSALLQSEPTAPASTLEALVTGVSAGDGLGGPRVRTPQTGNQDGTGKGPKSDAKGKDDKDKGKDKGKNDGKGDGKGSKGDGDGKGPKGEPKPDPGPTCPELQSATPAGPVPTEPTSPLIDVVGTLTCVEGAWYVGEALVSVGDDTWLAALALADHDADTALETNLEELTGLLDAEVTAGIDDERTVWTLQGQPYLPTPVVPPTETPDPTPTPTPSPSPSVSSPPSPSASPTRTPSATPSTSPSTSPSPSPSRTPSDSASASPSASPSATPSDTASDAPSAAPSDEPTATP